MRRIAATTIVLPSGETYKNHVVELYDNRVVNHYPLVGEIEMTEWLGGKIVCTEEAVWHITTDADGVQHKQQL